MTKKQAEGFAYFRWQALVYAGEAAGAYGQCVICTADWRLMQDYRQ